MASDNSPGMGYIPSIYSLEKGEIAHEPSEAAFMSAVRSFAGADALQQRLCGIRLTRLPSFTHGLPFWKQTSKFPLHKHHLMLCLLTPDPEKTYSELSEDDDFQKMKPDELYVGKLVRITRRTSWQSSSQLESTPRS